ncbi:hypothetical protein VTL71DRAFT_12521 [Oculimacula yallundae]|uniref:Aminoglycoside phosphotransferase domain-containing protein n=1 Tax=Oculimacula yallundae TaxID=86028 RepID=A0ABR4CPJ6_9HELO
MEKAPPSPPLPITHNHINYKARLDFIRNLFREQYGVMEPVKIVPIDYDPTCIHRYNNFVYLIQLPPGADVLQSPSQAQQPGCVPIPKDQTSLILRLTNHAARGLAPITRVENEVGMMNLASSALQAINPSIIPRVYGWSSAGKTPQGWILQEYMNGKTIDEKTFNSLSLEKRKHILAQIAQIVKALQDFELPASITEFGGVTFNEAGEIVSAAMTTFGAGPWPTYDYAIRGRLKVALETADRNNYIKGWQANNIRSRLDKFIESGLSAQLAPLATKDEKTIVHLDLNTMNLLIDPLTHRINALIDWDFSAILHPSYEFLHSFSGCGEQLPGWSTSFSSLALRELKLHGFPSPLPNSENFDFSWETAKAWEDELERVEAKRPRTMIGVKKVADIDALLIALVPWLLDTPEVRDSLGNRLLKVREHCEKELSDLLKHLGF